MKYKFPHITHIDQVREAIKGRSEFIEADRGEYIVFNYLVSLIDTFPAVTNEQEAILRECRGLTFYADTGEVAIRKYYKFFNAGEKAETQISNIDLSKPHLIMEKLDGSMLTPYVSRSGEIQFHTKMGATDIAKPVDVFAAKNSHIKEFSYDMWKNGYSTIYEWCSRQQRIVVDYPEEALILTAVRHNVTGEFMSYQEMLAVSEPYNVPVVRVFDSTTNDMSTFIDMARQEQDMEGYVIRFSDGHMLKVKNQWYVILHKAVSSISQEKDVWRMVLEDNADDVKPFLPVDQMEKFNQFETDLMTAVSKNVDDITTFIKEAKDDILNRDYSMFEQPEREIKKAFALEYVNGNNKFPSSLKGLLFHAFDNDSSIREEFIKWAVSNTSTNTKVDHMRSVFDNLRWNSVDTD